MFKILAFLLLIAACVADFQFDPNLPKSPIGDKENILASLNLTTGGPYTYSQSGHHFSGTGYDGSWIDTTAACSGQSGR